MQQTSLNHTKNLTGRELGRAKIEEVVARGRGRARQVIQHVQSLQPVDRVVKANKLGFFSEDEETDIFLRTPGEKGDFEKLHNNAIHQAADKAGIPWTFVEKLRGYGGWGRELLATNLSDIFEHNKEDKVLLRSVKGEVRGFLSDRYRRLDSRPLVDSFSKVCAEVGAVPYEGYATDTKIAIQAIIPRVYEPFPGEIMAYGVNFENSDFGNGALNVAIFFLRLWCDNGAIGTDDLRKVHLGKRLDENVEYSKETYELDQRTVNSAMGDIVRGNLAADRVELVQTLIRQAHETELTDDRRKVTVEMLKKMLRKEELDKAMKKFNEPDIELLPPGNNMWRMSNAISWLAGETADEERKLDLQKVAGKLLPAAHKAA